MRKLFFLSTPNSADSQLLINPESIALMEIRSATEVIILFTNGHKMSFRVADQDMAEGLLQTWYNAYDYEEEPESESDANPTGEQSTTQDAGDPPAGEGAAR